MRIPKDFQAGSRHQVNHGWVTVISYEGYEKVKVKFDNTGTIRYGRTGDIRNGELRDPTIPTYYEVGFIGIGNYKLSRTKAGSCWRDMMSRCYSPASQERHRSYIGCVVCEEWHNFQNFAKWFYDNYPKDGEKYQLDKDLKSGKRTGKLYSPNTCSFITHFENSEFANARKVYKFTSPEGEHFDIVNLRKFCRDNDLTSSAMYYVHNGKYSNHKGWVKRTEL